jgi:hypothetical protein
MKSTLSLCTGLSLLIVGTTAAANVTNTTLGVSRPFSFYNAKGTLAVEDKMFAGRCDHVFYPSGTPPVGGWPVYQFSCGTGQKPRMYQETLRHIASHGFVAAANLMDPWGSKRIPKATACYEQITGGGLPVEVNTDKIVAGGHSGGGPVAAILASEHALQGYIGQHAASILGVNRPTSSTLGGIKAALQLCGTKDTMPDCGCGPATKDYYARYPSTTPRMLAKSPFGHVVGTETASGDRAEGGMVVAFLYHVLKGDPDARAALVEAGSRKGYSAEDQL